MPELDYAVHDLKRELGDFLSRHRPDGVFYVQVGGPGSLPTLTDLDVPELHLDVQPGQLTGERRGLERLGYVPEGANWRHPGGWRVVLPDHDTGWRATQKVLGEYLQADATAAAHYRHLFQAQGREAADAALTPDALVHHAATVGFEPARFVAQQLQGLDIPWMFAAGMALDLHLGRVTRAHDDLDVVLPREAQMHMRETLRDWRLDACIAGTYEVWEAPLEPPHHQVHARHADLTAVIMLDLMFSDLSSGLWHYRRDPRITLPLSEARRITPDGLPYLAPQAALLFKSATSSGSPRPKDQADFERMLPALIPAEREWLGMTLAGIDAEHPWLTHLSPSTINH